jgi:hypothetical protein
MRDYVQKEPDKLEDVEAIFQVLLEQLDDLDLVLLDVTQDGVDVVLLDIGQSELIFQIYQLLDQIAV